MEALCPEYKNYTMAGLAPPSAFIPTKPQACVSGCEQLDKERQQPVFKPVQQVDPFAAAYSAGLLANPSIPRYGTVIPNRIFVGGIDFKTKEEDLQKFFCTFGRVKHTNIKRDRAEISKGFGFVTFESAEEANKVREQEDNLYMNGKKLNIGPAIRKQQPGFPKDIHLPGPPGSWVIHPAGYASFTNPNGITYFLDYNPPMMTSLQQPQAFPHGHMMAYNSEAYPTIPTHYTGYTCQTHNGQPYNALHLPCHAPIGGACGQLIAPPSAYAGVEQLNVLPMASSVPTPSYIVPRSIPANSQSIPVAATTRPSEVAAAPQEKPTYIAQHEPIRMFVPPTSSYVQPPVQPPFIHAPTAVYAQPAPFKCAHAQYIGIPGSATSPVGHYDVITEADVQASMTQPLVTPENEAMSSPLTTGQ